MTRQQSTPNTEPTTTAVLTEELLAVKLFGDVLLLVGKNVGLIDGRIDGENGDDDGTMLGLTL